MIKSFNTPQKYQVFKILCQPKTYVKFENATKNDAGTFFLTLFEISRNTNVVAKFYSFWQASPPRDPGSINIAL